MSNDTQEQAAENPDIELVLKKYLALQKKEQEIKEEKAELQQALSGHMRSIQRDLWYPEVDGNKLKVRSRESVSVAYNEDLLRERLADRYASILSPDFKKMKRCLGDIEPLLAPMIGRIGTPSPDKVRKAVESGTVQKEEFAGAFEKTTRQMVSVMRMRAGEQE